MHGTCVREGSQRLLAEHERRLLGVTSPVAPLLEAGGMQRIAAKQVDWLMGSGSGEEQQAWIARHHLGMRVDSRVIRLLGSLPEQVVTQWDGSGILTELYAVPRDDMDRATVSVTMAQYFESLGPAEKRRLVQLLPMILHGDVVELGHGTSRLDYDSPLMDRAS